MRSTQCDTPINSARAAELLDVDSGHQPAETVTHEIDTAATNVSAEVLTQRKRGSLDPCTGSVIERQDLLDAPKAKGCGQWKENRSIGKVTMHENDSPLMWLTRGAASRRLDSEGEEHRCHCEGERLPRDQSPDRLRGRRIVLNHLVTPPEDAHCTV